jgi:hypothetical protein
MVKWRSYVNKTGKKPGKMTNKKLMQLIEQMRKETNHPRDETELGINEKHHFYSLSVNFFKFFYDLYGCDQIIMLKYEDVIEEGEKRGRNKDLARQQSIRSKNSTALSHKNQDDL